MKIQDLQIASVTSLYLLCCILRIVKIKDLANTITAALFCPLEAFILKGGAKPNGSMSGNGFTHESQQHNNLAKGNIDHNNLDKGNAGSLRNDDPNSSSCSQVLLVDVMENGFQSSHLALRYTVYI